MRRRTLTGYPRRCLRLRIDKEVRNRVDRLELPFDAFRDQVLPFLDPEVTELYDSKAAWEQMQLFVTDKLLAVR